MKDAEDLAADKEREYTRGFKDCVELIDTHAQRIVQDLPESDQGSKRFARLLREIEDLYALASERHEDLLNKWLGILPHVDQDTQSQTQQVQEKWPL